MLCLVLFPDFLTFTYSFRRFDDYRYEKAFQFPHSLNFHTLILYFNLFSDSSYIIFLSDDGIATSINK